MKKPPIINKRLQIVVLVVILIAVVMFSFPADNGNKSSMKPKAPTKKAAKIDKTADEFTAADRTTTFEPTVMTVANVFKPLVYRKDAPGGSSGGDGSSAANAVPADFADGDANWRYTGTLEIDNALSALIENRNTKDGLYLTRGQHWHNCVVQQITSSTVTLAGPSGSKTLQLVTEDAPAAKAPAAAAPVQPDAAQQQQQFGGRGRGNRGNNGQNFGGQFGNFGGGNGGFGGGNPFSGQIGGTFAPGSITVTPERSVIASPGGVR